MNYIVGENRNQIQMIALEQLMLKILGQELLIYLWISYL